MSAVAESVKADPHICMWEISSKLALSLGTVHKIPQDNVQMRKLPAKRIPHKLTDIQKACWVNSATCLFNLTEPNGQKHPDQCGHMR